MKDEAFGFSGDCHDPGLAGPLGLPFPLASVISASTRRSALTRRRGGGNPGSCLSYRWIPATNRGDDRKRVGYDGGQRG
jgi:hypothetical protein